jgi:hypothetical protein
MVAQADQLIMSAINALEGPEEANIVRQLLRLRDELSGRLKDEGGAHSEELRVATLGQVNDYFHHRLTALPGIADYLEDIATRAP